MNSVDRITDRPDMTSAVYSGFKASNQTKLGRRRRCLLHKTVSQYLSHPGNKMPSLLANGLKCIFRQLFLRLSSLTSGLTWLLFSFA